MRGKSSLSSPPLVCSACLLVGRPNHHKDDNTFNSSSISSTTAETIFNARLSRVLLCAEL